MGKGCACPRAYDRRVTESHASLAALRRIVGDSHLLTDPSLRAGYEVDWTRRFGGPALAVARPADVEELAGVVKVCAEAGVAIVPQGGNTGLVGGGVPRNGELVVSLARLRDVEPVDGLAGEALAGAGVTLAALQQHVRAAGWEFGVDLGARDSATIGGMVATNAGGLHLLRYGGMRAQVIGLEAVLADGSVVRRLSGLAKDNTGYDLAGLLTGSEGTLGIVTRARLRLVPPLPGRSVALVGLPNTAAAVSLVARLRRAPWLLAAELFFPDGLELVARHSGARPPLAGPHGAYLLVEAAAERDPTDEMAAALQEESSVVLASDPAGRRRLWELRERHTEAIGAQGIAHKLDIGVPVARLAEFVERVQETVSRTDPTARTILYGHIADGNLHVNVLGPAADDERVDDEVLELVIQMAGTVSAEHGVGVAKRRWFAADRGAADLAAMRAVKDALDPRGILNPGVLFEPS